MQNGTLLAAVDLGSNSFRLEIGRFDHGRIHRIEYLKGTMRQCNGLDSDRKLLLGTRQAARLRMPGRIRQGADARSGCPDLARSRQPRGLHQARPRRSCTEP